MAKLTAQQVAEIAYRAGFRGQALVEMVAIAKRESGYNTESYNGNTDTGDQSYGLWQINMLGAMGPARRKQFGITNNEQLLDPNVAARAAFALSGNGTNLSPWGGYKGQSNTYSTDVPAARAAVESAGLPDDWNSAAQGQPSAGSADMAAEVPPMDGRTAQQYAIEEYGQYAAFLEDPEIGPILLRAAAAKPPWSEAVLEGELHKTNWWQTTNQSVRQWMALESADKTTAQSQVNGRAAEIMARANQLGFPTSRARAEVVARDSLKFGWQGAELDRAIGLDASQQQLLTSSFGTSLKQTASSFGVPISQATLGSWATRIAAGEDTEENFVSWARDMAANMYPTIQAHLARGGTTEQFYDPYREQAAKTLQIAPETIDLSDPKWGAALSIKDPNGETRAMRMDEWQKMLMSDDKYGFRYTQNAKTMAEDFVGNLKRMFGEIA